MPDRNSGFQEKLGEFEKRETAVVGCSIDSEESHLACLGTSHEKGGIKGITFPLITDVSKTIALNYGVLGSEYAYGSVKKVWSFNGAPVTLRSTFLIDKDGIIRHQSINYFSLGRNAEEYLHLVDAQLLVEKNGQIFPPNWQEGNEETALTSDNGLEYFIND